MKKLVTFGDSFTYGEELAERSDAWPQQLANRLGYQTLNFGEPGTCNDSMVRKLLEFLSDPIQNVDIGLVVIAWSNPGRREYADEAGAYTIWPGANAVKFRKEMPWREGLVEYLNEYHNTKWFCQQYVHNVILAQSVLRDLNIPYLMLDIMHNEYYKKLHLNSLTSLCKLVDTSRYIGWGNSGMAEWVGNVKRGTNGHFLEEGHRVVADRIYEYYKING
jgi:hypothetical protein